MVGDGQRCFGVTNFSPRHPQAFKCLRAGDFMHQMAVDIEQAGAIRRLMHEVAVEDFIEECLGGHSS